ncbi:MAG: queuosine precursor transporter [Saprospiraceae bacterium]
MSSILKNKGTRLFLVLGGFFIANALIAEFIGVKIFSLEETLGWEKIEFNLFGKPGSLVFTAGVLLWPVVFIMTDIINEYFGQKGVRFLSYLAVVLIAYAFFMVFNAISLAPADWWVGQYSANGVPDMQAAFSSIFGQGNWIIVGSLVAFLLGQIIDVLVFHRIKKVTGEKQIWLRATGSTLISQFIDSFVVLYIAFVLGPAKWSMDTFLNVGMVNYIYKFIMAIALTPLIYLAHWLIDRYLGKELSAKMRNEAMEAN